MIISAVISLLIFIIILYSGYAVYDSYYKGSKAFVSADLLKYKPSISEDTRTGFRELRKLNPDVVGWLTINDTNINYPVTQGENDTEYASKDVYGKSALTGSIYLSSENDSDFNDRLNLIYGHHMDNGAMFGDIEKYSDEDFFKSHRKGLLQTPNGNYDLKIFAVVKTDAYDQAIYSVADRSKRHINAVLDYLKNNSLYYDRDDSMPVRKIIAMSTCDDAVTLGRTILFADAYERSGGVGGKTKEDDEVTREAVGHDTEGADHWALLNLICLIMTLITLLPLTQIRRKYRQISYSKDKIDEVEDALERDLLPETEPSYLNKVTDDLRSFIRKMYIGIAMEIVAILAAVIAFILTEDISSKMVIRDEWTWLMVLIFAVSIIFDFIFFRFRGAYPPEMET